MHYLLLAPHHIQQKLHGMRVVLRVAAAWSMPHSSHSDFVYDMIALSDCPKGIKAKSINRNGKRFKQRHKEIDLTLRSSSAPKIAPLAAFAFSLTSAASILNPLLISGLSRVSSEAQSTQSTLTRVRARVRTHLKFRDIIDLGAPLNRDEHSAFPQAMSDVKT